MTERSRKKPVRPGRGRRILIGLLSGLVILAVLLSAFGVFHALTVSPR